MSGSLFDKLGHRKYLVARERLVFVLAAHGEDDLTASFCLTVALTGARISEVLALTADRVDIANEAIVIETLKQRTAGYSVPCRFQFGCSSELRSSELRLVDACGLGVEQPVGSAPRQLCGKRA